MAYPDRLASAESSGDATATNPNSSATGLHQFIDSTWLDLVTKYRPDLASGKSPDEILALRKDPQISTQMADLYGNINGGILSKAGFPVTDGTKSLAHFAGPKGAVGILSADPNTPAGSILGQAAVAANPFLRNMTAGDLVAWAGRRVGDKSAAPLSMAGPVRSAGPVMASPEPAAPDTPEQKPQPAASPAMPEPDLSGLFDAPKLPSILTPRPRLSLAAFKPAPFSFRGMR